MPNAGRHRQDNRRATLLVAATVASLAATLVAGFVTRQSLVDANGWVTHTYDVTLAIDEGQFALDRDDADALRAAEAKIERLTIDNPRQQHNVGRATLLTERGERTPIAALFTAMQKEEDRLMGERVRQVAALRVRSSAVFVLGAVLTVLFGMAAFLVLQTQRRDLAKQRALLEEQRALLEAIIESVDEGIVAVSASRQMLAINAAARAFWGASFPRNEWPKDWSPVLRATYEDGSAMPPEQGPLARAVRGVTSEGVIYRVAPATEPADVGRWVSASARPIRDESGQVIAAVTTLRDITEQRATAERFRDQSLTDELTGLLNRRGFMTLAGARLEASRKTKGPLALLYADINGLKPINDGLGHEQGDRAIQDAAHVLRRILRDQDVVARLGGDEFVALLPNVAPAAREPLLERLTRTIRSHVEQEQRLYRLSISADISFVSWDPSPSLEGLLSDADRKMYERKRERARQQSAPSIHPVPFIRRT